MGVREVTYYTVTCDGCGHDAFEGGETTAWSDANGARESALAIGWTEEDTPVGSIWRCFDCQIKQERKDEEVLRWVAQASNGQRLPEDWTAYQVFMAARREGYPIRIGDELSRHWEPLQAWARERYA